MAKGNSISIPKNGLSKEEIFAQITHFQEKDIDWKNGKFFGYVFYPGQEIYDIIQEAYKMYMSANGLNPAAFPGLRKMETDVVSIAANLFHGNEATTGVMTSGGTESIMMALLSAREYAKKIMKIEGVPEVILPESVHPAFNKACHFFGLKEVIIPVKDDFRADVQAIEKAITKNTVLLVGSAPQYPQGVIDPIEEIAALAKQKNLLCHVDACVGGFMLPFLEKSGVTLPIWDFRVDGVTSISADLHKYGYAAKGASLIMYKNSDIRKQQFYIKTDWMGGIYGSPSFAGTRPGGAIAAAWATLHAIGEEGYVNMVHETYQATQKLIQGIRAYPELQVFGEPNATLFSFGSNKLDIQTIGDELAELGWYINRQTEPPGLHCFVTHHHVDKVQVFLDDLAVAVKKAKSFSLENIKKDIQVGAVKQINKLLPKPLFEKLTKLAGQGGGGAESKRKAAMYGMMGELKGTGTLEEMVLKFVDELNSPEQNQK
ncbi:MAG: aspartate aminotransferase family protein [Chitinophagales bacterium]|nr:aspartate aminotransferase family protein [Chitinophagales bacterium]